ncbi:uncharacterized protein LOC123515825 isoform X1 [Portunus trituberculatus]|uniref:uncharacterized protein LOC123515825 isoform X1 n=1 Tax=Portunus trituberculatus TaxID=210409 RepID=UPI001E1D0F9D|nr:uncharacterized protein LOC123515825 isoform X1 [Portunus trituberculatus]XP_045130629.1 uncharacterized protein LOC123515825 isoform X1 [Portunus trituberculatus]
MDTGVGETYDITSINKALDDLGMLSTTTASRKEYLHECLRASMEKLNVDQPGPSTSRWDAQKSSGSPSSIEKENTNIGGFQILKMNSTFITSFTAGYELPCHGLRERFTNRVIKCGYARRRRLRTHPYDNSSVTASTSDTSSYSSGSYRLRTTSLSSGTSKKKTSGSYINTAVSGNSCSSNNSGNSNCSNSTKPVLVRSRSMENLSASMGDGLVLTYKPKELETVSRGIQQLKMDDCT